MKKSTKRPNLIVITTTLIIVTSIIVLSGFYLAKQKSDNYITFTEDVNNSCTATDENTVSSGVAQNIITIKVHKNDTEDFLRQAHDQHRCVNREE